MIIIDKVILYTELMREIGEKYDPTAAKQLMDSMYQKALDACRNESEREEVHPLTLAKLEDFGILSLFLRAWSVTSLLIKRN